MEVYVASEKLFIQCIHMLSQYFRILSTKCKKINSKQTGKWKVYHILAMFPWNLGCKTVEN